MEQARAAGIPVGTLYIVSRPLSAGSLGTYDRDTGDLATDSTPPDKRYVEYFIAGTQPVNPWSLWAAGPIM